MIDLINFNIPSQEQETERLLSLIDDNFQKEEGSIFYDVMSIIAKDNIEKYRAIKEIFKNSFGLTATGQFLDLKTEELGVERKQGTRARGTVTFTGSVGAKIPFNTVVLCDSLQFKTLNDSVVSSSGEVNVEIEATEVGRDYNLKPNLINKISTTLQGIDKVINKLAITGGEDIETDSELRARYLQRVREPATSGNAYDYKKWATSIDGIGQAKVYPLHNGPGTVKVVVVSNQGGTVLEDKLREVREFIETVRPVGATVTVVNANPLTITISARITKSNLVDIETMKQELKDKLNEYITNVNLNSSSFSYGRVSAILYSIKGLTDFNDLRINGNTNSITIPNESIAILGEVNLNV